MYRRLWEEKSAWKSEVTRKTNKIRNKNESVGKQKNILTKTRQEWNFSMRRTTQTFSIEWGMTEVVTAGAASEWWLKLLNLKQKNKHANVYTTQLNKKKTTSKCMYSRTNNTLDLKKKQQKESARKRTKNSLQPECYIILND